MADPRTRSPSTPPAWVSGPRICLITPGHLVSTPRLVKAANALSTAGYAVHVVAARHFSPADVLDDAILHDAPWQCERVRAQAGLAGLTRRLLRLGARHWLARHPAGARLAARAQHAGTGALTAAAARIPAALYFGHGGVAGLAVAAAAARRRGTPYGFDAEDWHEAEGDFVQHDPAERTAVRLLLRTWLPGARLVTCAAPLIGQAFAERYGITPVCVLNVFPLAEAPAAPVPAAPPTGGRPAVLYWFSQTVGPERGLEGIIDVLGKMTVPAELHLRGFIDPRYRESLERRATAAGIRRPLGFLPPAPAAEMARLAAGAHLGLSLEQSSPPNRDLCLTNKIFTCLLAGVPVALTPTAAQRALAPELGAAAVLLAQDNPSASAAALDRWLTTDQLRAAATAWRLGRERFNWDREQSILLDAMSRSFPPLS
jgi:hypothetical protein